MGRPLLSTLFFHQPVIFPFGMRCRTCLLILLIGAISVAPLFAQDSPCSPRAEIKNGKIRLRSADGGEHQLEDLRCYPGYLFAQRKGKWAILDEDGYFKTTFVYDGIQAFDRGLAAARKDGLQGYVDDRGREIIPIRFEKIRELGPERFLAHDEKGWILLDRRGQPVDGEPYEKVSALIQGFSVTKRDSLFGIISDDGRVVCSPRYTEITKFFEGLAMVQRDGLWGHMNVQGREVIPVMYDEVFVFFDSLSIARKGSRWGYINRRNEAVLPFEFDYVEYFESGRALVSRNGRWGYIDKQGNELIPIQYNRIHPFHDGMAKIELEGKEGYIRENGEAIIPPIYNEIYRFADGIAITRQDGRYGFVRSDGTVLSEPVWDGVQSFRDGIARVQLGDRFGLINRENEMLLQPEYDEIGTYEGGMVSVRKGMDWVFVDALPDQGPIALNPERAARIKVGEQWGYIDQSGRTYGFDDARVEFSDEWASLGRIGAREKAAFTFHYRNNGPDALRITDIHAPCGCDVVRTPSEGVGPGEYGQIHLQCETWGIRPVWEVRIPVQFEGQPEPVLLGMQALREVPDSARQLLEEVPINGRYVFLMDISASMDELPLAKMIFSRLAASLCREDNVSIVSFNSFSKVELRPTENHSEVVHTIRQLRPSLKTDAARGLRLSYAILDEPIRSLEKHIYMASDGDIDTAQLARVLQSGMDREVLLTIFVFSYTGDRTAYEYLVSRPSLRDVRFVYVDRENISGVLEQEYTDIGCLAPFQHDGDTTDYQNISKAPYGGMITMREQRRYGVLDTYRNVLLQPIYEFVDYPGEGLIRTRLGEKWALHDRCQQLTATIYDSIGHFEHHRALASRNGLLVLLDREGREYDFLPDWNNNPVYRNTDTLQGQPFVNLTLLLDISGSMDSPEKLPLLKETFSAFSALLRYEDRISIVTYTSTATLQLPSVSASQRKRINETIARIQSKGNTVLLDGLEMAYRQASAAYIEGGNNRVILATDGRFDLSEDLLRLLDRFRARDIHISFYLFGDLEKKIYSENLKMLAERAGGSYHYATAENINQLMLEEALVLRTPPSRSGIR